MSRERFINVLILLCALALLVMAIVAGEEAFGWFSHGVVVAVALYVVVRKR